MAEIRPFKGVHFNLKKPQDLSSLIAPPYDMIDDPMLDDLYKRNETNVARIDQNRKEPQDTANRDRHRRAGGIFRSWLDSGVLARDNEPSIYVYEQHFSVASAGRQISLERTGITVLVKLTDFSEGVVIPHEYTLSGPKQDRYEHLDELRANVGQIFGLVPDDSGELYKLIRACRTAAPIGVADDSVGVEHVLYKCSDKALLDNVCKTIAGRTILIADGHHRYETALNFCRDKGNPAYGWVMMTLVSMADPGLVIRPFHRLIRKGMNARLDTSLLQRYFTMKERGPFSADTVNSFLGANSDKMLYADCKEHKMYEITLNDEGLKYLNNAMPEHTVLWKQLDVSKITYVIIQALMGLTPDGHVLHDMVDYQNDPSAAVSRLQNSNDYHGAFFIKPVSIGTVQKIAGGGERMPQKSTNFYPKLFSGLVINTLDNN